MEEVIQELILRERYESLSTEDAARLLSWRKLCPANESSYQAFAAWLDDFELAERFESIDLQAAWSKVSHRMDNRKPVRHIRDYGLTAAAILLIGIFTVLYVYTQLEKSDTKPLNSVLDKKMDPGSAAYIQLADGRRLDLKTRQGALQSDRGLSLGRNRAGILQMDADPGIAAGQQWVDLITPKGSSYQLILGDGTKVFLNSESKLRYPIQFAQNSRTVELVGEALFEVSKNPKAPFTVTSRGMHTTVLGTTFNISAYPDDRRQHVTLLEGKVAVRSAQHNFMLHPGEQLLAGDSPPRILSVDPRLYSSWATGTLRFQDMKLGEITQKLQRWYDVDFVFPDPSAQELRFTGAFDRTARLGDLLATMESMTKVQFIEEKQKITVQKR